MKYGERIVSVGVDTWGVDFGLLAARDELLGNPVHYRDRRTEGMLEQAFQVVPRDEIFAQTGLQFMQFNTLFQLFAMRREGSPLLDAAQSLLMMPDLFHWLLSGEKSNEYTNATTTQFFNPQAERLGLSVARAVRHSRSGCSARSRRRARGWGRCAASVASGNCRSAHAGRVARHARHGQRRDGGARQQRTRARSPTGATSAAAPGR